VIKRGVVGDPKIASKPVNRNPCHANAGG
jgi:hypothetical protein